MDKEEIIKPHYLKYLWSGLNDRMNLTTVIYIISHKEIPIYESAPI